MLATIRFRTFVVLNSIQQRREHMGVELHLLPKRKNMSYTENI